MNTHEKDEKTWTPLEDLSSFFVEERDRLRRMVQFRLDLRLQSRIDPSDVLQEAYLEASQRFDQYRTNPTMPPFLWLRFLVGQKLLQFHRRHLGAKARDAAREVHLPQRGIPEASSAVVAKSFVGKLTSPSQAAIRDEMRLRLQSILERMDAIDREVLILRHFEQLSNAETAQALEIDESAASKRYVRALKRLKEALQEYNNFPDDLLDK